MQYKICDLPSNEKPRERLMSFGAASLSDSELLAIILRSGGKESSAISLAREILINSGGLKNLHNLSFEKLRDIKNVGIAKAASLKAVCEVSLRINSEETITRKKVCKPEDVYRLVKRNIYKKNKEILILLSLDSRNRAISVDVLSVGSVTSAIIDTREIFRQALHRNAVSIILVHNHPSGDTTPSSEDLILTESITKASKLMNIPLLDHVIVTDDQFASLKALDVFSTKKFST